MSNWNNNYNAPYRNNNSYGNRNAPKIQGQWNGGGNNYNNQQKPKKRTFGEKGIDKNGAPYLRGFNGYNQIKVYATPKTEQDVAKAAERGMTIQTHCETRKGDLREIWRVKVNDPMHHKPYFVNGFYDPQEKVLRMTIRNKGYVLHANKGGGFRRSKNPNKRR